MKARPLLWHFFPVPVFLLPDDGQYSGKKTNIQNVCVMFVWRVLLVNVFPEAEVLGSPTNGHCG